MRGDTSPHTAPSTPKTPEQGEEQAWKSKGSAGAGLEGELCAALIQVFPSQAANCQNRFSRSFPGPRQPCCLSEPCESWRLRWEVEAGNCSPTHTPGSPVLGNHSWEELRKKAKDFSLPSQGLAETPALGHKAGREALGPLQPLARALRQ